MRTLPLLLLVVPAVASAQNGDCPSEGSDAFALARRSRRIIADYQRLHTIHSEDMARNAHLYRRQTGEEMPWSFGAAALIEYEQNFGFDVCTNLGPWDATLTPILVGGITTFELNRLGLRFEGFAFTTSDALVAAPTEAQTRTPDGGFREPTGLASVSAREWMYGGRFSLFDWVSVVGGYIETTDAVRFTGEDGRMLIVDDVPSVRPGRVYLGAGVPRYGLYAHLLFDDEDVATDDFQLLADAIPFPEVPFFGIAGVGYIEDESQATVTLGLADIIGLFTVDVSFEHRPVALRHARIRVDWDAAYGLIPTEPVEDPKDARPRMGVDLGAFGELTWFGSRHLEEQTGTKNAWGFLAGTYVRPDITILAARLDLYFGINSPDALARFSELVGHWQMGVRVQGRFGL